MVKDADIVGEALARVLPSYDKPWYRVPHLLKLNMILLVPLLSSAVAGYDGKTKSIQARSELTINRIDDERASINQLVEGILQQSNRL